MRISLGITVLIASAPAFAQAVPVPPQEPPGGCVAPPPEGRDADGAIAEPGFGFISIVSPPNGARDVPRNVEVRLGGSVAELDFDPPMFFVELRDVNGARIPFEREGGKLRPLVALPPNGTFIVHIEATDANPCPDCVGISESSFTTGVDEDFTPPVLEGAPPVHVFVLPTAECTGFQSQTHQIVVDWGPGMPINTWVVVAGRAETTEPQLLREFFNGGAAFSDFLNLGQIPVALGDAFVLAFTPRDLAGNVGPARIVRIRARSFTDANLPRDQLAPLWCDLPSEPEVVVPSALPTNGRIQARFPFEEIPVGLRAQDDSIIPLVPIEDTLEQTSTGHVYETAVPLPAGATFDVVPLECPHCVCAGCTSMTPVSITVAASADDTPPAAPVLIAFEEDASPDVSVGTCGPDRPALIAVLQPGEDDLSAATDLRYDVTLRIVGSVPLALGTSLVPEEREDGTIAVRIETRSLGRVLGENFDLTLDAKDAAGNTTSATFENRVDEGGGCTCASASGAPLLLALIALARRRRS